MGLLEGRRVLVTGGGSGIGRATAARAAAGGAAVAVLDVDGGAAEAAAEEVGGVALVADVADRTALEAAFATAADRLGGLDTVVNNAGTGNVMPLHRYPGDEWERLINVNLRGVFNGIAAAVEPLRAAGGGAIVNVSSVSGMKATRGEGPYSAAKAGVLALTQAAALEYAPAIRVNCVSPGFVHTALTDFAVQDARLRAAIEAGTPLGRVARAEEVADTIVFLCSDLATYVTGANLVVDGGSSLTSAQADPLLAEILAAFG